MPFSKTPSISTYQTKKISLVAEMNSRFSTPDKDVDYLNCFVEATHNKETQQQSQKLRQRDGCSLLLTLAASARAVYYWEDFARLYVAVGHNLAVYSMPAGTLVTTLVNVFPTTSTGEVGITNYLYDTGIEKLVVSDGTTLSTVDSSNVVVASTSVNLPVHLPQIVYLDGYIYLIKVGTADLYNSNLNDPLLYTAGDFISAELVPDQASYLLKLNNYLLVFGNDSIEYFWDAGNETGSPLQRNDTPVKLVGFGGGIAQLGSKVYFVGDNNHSQQSVFVLEDFKITEVGTDPLRRFLSAAPAGIKANLVSISGHDFYVLSTGGYAYVMEAQTNLWSRWAFGTSTASFDMTYSACYKAGDTYQAVFSRASDLGLYVFNPLLGQDNGQTLTSWAVLSNEAFDTFNQKTMSRLTVWAEQTSSSNPILIQWSDDDYQTWGAGQTVELNQEMPCIYQLGRFRRRAFKITHTANNTLGLFGLEVDINIGRQ